MRIGFILCILLALSLHADAQAATEQSSTAGPSLPVTLQFIADKLNALGSVAVDPYANTGGSKKHPTVYYTYTLWTISRVVWNADACTMTVHFVDKEILPTAPPGNPNEGPSGDVTWKIRRDFVNFTVSTTDSKGVPFGKDGKDAVTGKPLFLVGHTYPPIYFTDEALAIRVSKAATHAAALCGANSPDPF